MVTSRFSRFGNAFNPSTLLSWLLAKLITFTCGRAPTWTIAVSLFFDRSTFSRFGKGCSNSAGIQVKPSPDKLKYRKGEIAAPYNNMRTPRCKPQLTNAFFRYCQSNAWRNLLASNHCRVHSNQIKSLSTVQTTQSEATITVISCWPIHTPFPPFNVGKHNLSELLANWRFMVCKQH